MNFTDNLQRKRQRVDAYLRKVATQSEPVTLYEPIRYIVSGGGKRLRSLLIMFACEAVGGKSAAALHAGAAVELLHTFTLVHDDIMDHADSRRGKQTVHKKWDENVAILAGDALLCLAYRILLRTSSSNIQSISTLFTEGVLEVCEGQTYDKEFEERDGVTVDDYLLMISKKTGALFAMSAQIGGLIGGAKNAEVRALKRYGEYIGRAFQIQDDLLDILGNEATLGKSIGGDLQEGKKTFLLLHAASHAHSKDSELLRKVFTKQGLSKEEVDSVRELYRTTGAIALAESMIEDDIRRAVSALRSLRRSARSGLLVAYADMLLKRTY